MCSQVMKMYLVLKFDFNFWNKKDLSLKASQRSNVAFVRLEHSVYTTRLCIGAPLLVAAALRSRHKVAGRDLEQRGA